MGAERTSEIFQEDEKNNDAAGGMTDVILERTVWHKIDRWILPVITIFYLLSFLDRVNIGNARLYGLQKDLNISNKEYTIALTLTYVAYVSSELPSNLVLKRIGPSILLPTIMVLWGVVATLQGVVTNYQGLLACRFFIGFLEGGVPGIVLYLSLFYPRQKLQTRIAMFFSAASLSGAFSGILAFGIRDLDGKRGHSSAAWIFLIEGAITVACGLAAFFILPRSPTSARFLTEQEKQYVAERLREDRVMSKDPGVDAFSWSEVGRAFTSVQVILVGVIYFWNVTVAAALISDFYKCRGAVIIGGAVICVAGFGLFLGPSPRLIADQPTTISNTDHCFSRFLEHIFIQPALAAWNANNSAPYIRRATTMALGFMMTNSGGILATWLFGVLSPVPRYVKAMQTLLIFSVLMGLFAALNIWYLSRQNKAKAIARGSTDSSADAEKMGDRSPWFVYSM
ncbi:major facilitator superfamily domain-containing protein [Mycena olivaceomarginata]|nr:major facilitator superfamily domain-containing protein [Mycena olivaceomarginata]